MATPGSNLDDEVVGGEVKTKLNGVPFPPRPKAIATFLSSRDFLDGCQTLLYSLKTQLAQTPKDQYPPEIVVLLSSKLVDSKAAPSIKKHLYPIFCDRIIVVEHIPIKNDPNNDEGKPSHVQSWDENCGWTKLRLFELESYDTILYIDADCLVVKDVEHLLHVDEPTLSSVKNGGEEQAATHGRRVGLLAAAPDIFPPDKFNAGVMVLRPSKQVFQEMMSCLPNSTPKQNDSAKTCESYDGGDTGFLNSFYPGWYRDMPSYSRLSFGYNAQRFMHHCTYEKQPKYWDAAIEDMRIIHFSSSPKPWDKKADKPNSEPGDKQSYLDGDDATSIQKAKNYGKLESMWNAAFTKSQDYHTKELRKKSSKEKESLSQKRRAPSAASSHTSSRAPSGASSRATSRSSASAASARPQNPHNLVHKRYKELRKAGMGTKEAMKVARADYGLDKDDEGMDPSKAVGQMFGLA